jgi:hypothetical protein
MTTIHRWGHAARRAVLLALSFSPVAALRASAQRAPDDSLLVAKERAMWDALKTRDTVAFARLMGGGVVDIDASGARRTSPATTARFVTGCQTPSYTMSDVDILHDGNVAIVTSKVFVEQTCWGQKAPSPLNVMTVYVRRASDWSAVAHSETPAGHY